MTKQEIKQAFKQFNLMPEFQGANLWTVRSGAEVYRLEVYFTGYSTQTSHGLELKAECSCIAARFGRTCAHANAVLYQYDNRWSLLFPLFNLTKEEQLKPIYDKAAQTFERMQRNGRQAA